METQVIPPLQTLVVVNVELPKDKKAHLSLLDGLQDYKVWFFYRNDLRLNAIVGTSFAAHFHQVPAAEADALEYITKAVLFEVAQNNVYGKVVLLSPAPGGLRSLVDFLQSKGLAVEVYDLAKKSAQVTELKGKRGKAKTSRVGRPKAAPLPNGEKRGRGRPRKNPEPVVAAPVAAKKKK